MKESEAESHHPRIRFDYCIISDRSEEGEADDEDEEDATNREAKDAREVKAASEDDEARSTTILVMQESETEVSGRMKFKAKELQMHG